jgi:hypothetical protein
MDIQKHFKVCANRIKVKLLDLSHYPMIEHNWLHSVYGNVWELIPPETPDPLEKAVVLTHYADAN